MLQQSTVGMHSHAQQSLTMALSRQALPHEQHSLSQIHLGVQELDDKVHTLHDQRIKQLNLERECSRLRQDIDRLAVLQPLLDGQSLACICRHVAFLDQP